MLRYVTTNDGKVREAEAYLDDDVAAFEYDYQEIQADSLEAVAADGARKAYRHVGEPVIVDDAGLYLEGFDGFPGPYSAYVENTLGVECVGRLARREEATQAKFRCVIAYCDGDSFEASPEPVDTDDRRGTDIDADERATAATDETVAGEELPVKLFPAAVPGHIVEPRGDGGFGYDPIFEHDGTTFAEMTPEEKNAVSHRGRALSTFAEWYAGR
ncbi:non-canonical purine NTP pyrophosphatase [Natronomonas pharaonis DSM 2160]|uniref:Non-canonical purine NTP pyrophosphatase n=1 Tax=Natronomonas pharaonis (strain ATCC 35678 / DSM 2160 / CIP 103997 / JCM 8858 / NBRC 14720 / NCIMB 2260 / Gabara) TaxID=348780 RepID=A0A1U7EYJ0_NATPD|nr:non-canonical purine NTP pyrophosphatase [Natronomonas pharaonis]CAI50304.1 non-canonical purine NTP pyrophosphatase [Natronomonas pharaonis DSM 2160]